MQQILMNLPVPVSFARVWHNIAL